ncbi:hypothetical protein CBL_09026 [Carabus blaptoides fortunei]
MSQCWRMERGRKLVLVGRIPSSYSLQAPSCNKQDLTNIHPWFRIIIQRISGLYRRSIISKLSLVRHGTAILGRTESFGEARRMTACNLSYKTLKAQIVDYCTNKRAKSSLHNSIIAEVSTTCAQGGGIDHSYMSSRVAEVAEIPVAIFMHLSKKLYTKFTTAHSNVLRDKQTMTKIISYSAVTRAKRWLTVQQR